MKIPEGWKLVPIEPTEDMMYELTGSDNWDAASRLWQAALAAAPTPPAQEDEPVAFPTDNQLEVVLIPLIYKYLTPKAIEHTTYTSWKDGIDIECVAHGMRTLIKEVIKLYSRPQSDKLRKAAEALLRDYDEEYGDFSEPYATRFEKLRTTLEGK